MSQSNYPPDVTDADIDRGRHKLDAMTPCKDCEELFEEGELNRLGRCDKCQHQDDLTIGEPQLLPDEPRDRQQGDEI